MTSEHHHTLCPVTQKPTAPGNRVPLALIRPAVLELIIHQHPETTCIGWISRNALNMYRGQYMQALIEQNTGDITELDRQVIESIQEHNVLTRDINNEYKERETIAQKSADQIAHFGGSWSFVLGFCFIILLWMIINTYWLIAGKAFDPFPFILLNLVLSCLAALQAPIIMMSQNRQAAKDRLRADNEYKINLKSELEIRNVSTKLDWLMEKQWTRLLEIQQMQTDMLNEISDRKRK